MSATPHHRPESFLQPIRPGSVLLALLLLPPLLQATESVPSTTSTAPDAEVVSTPATDQTTRDSTPLEEVEDLQALGVTLHERNLPLLLAFVADYCTYCERLKREHLVPMVKSGDYQNRILIRTVHLDHGQQLTDFNGERIGIKDFSRRYGVKLTPALLFLDADGEEVTERLLGYSVPDFYGVYLERSITAAGRAVKPSTTLLPEALRQCDDG
ncbi:MAG TPA: thioredoxin fold domain-containing protein [Thiolinea sp.]|nr:thioredoxin fold domain-containing protein [Thiolinea sp.]